MGAREERLKELYELDFEQIELEWFQDYSEDLPERDEDCRVECLECLGRGCHFCLMLDSDHIA